ncbi:MAG: hypothetical protein AABX54_01140 [Nanoarchaeota archaeon]
MVRIDFERLAEDARIANAERVVGILKCMRSEKRGEGAHIGEQLFLGYDTGTSKTANYECSRCGWHYSRAMTSEEIAREKRNSDNYRARVLAGAC